MGSAASTAAHAVLRERRTRALLLRYGDAKAEVQDLFKSMKMSRDLRLSLLQRWQFMDNDESNLLDYKEFLQGCGLKDELWSWRMFNLLDKNFTGCIDFCTFIRSLPRLLVYDRANAIEVAFRMCSRRGATCASETAVLDEKDMRYFVEQRYPTLDRRRSLHRATQILQHLDEDTSAGISLEEFENFCSTNPVFLTAAHKTLQSMREAIFGEAFWKDFTIRARSFDQATQGNIFCALSAHDIHSDSMTAPGDVKSDNFSTETVRSNVARRKKREVDDMNPAAQTAQTTTGKLRKVASEPSVVPQLDTMSRATGHDEVMKKLSSWASTAKLKAAVDMKVSSRAGTAAGSLRRIASDTHLIENPSRNGGQQTSLLSAHDRARSLKLVDVQHSLRSARQQAARKLDGGAYGVSHVGTLVREKSTRELNKTRQLLRVEKEGFVGKTEAIRAKAAAKRLKAVILVIMITKRLQKMAAQKAASSEARIAESSRGLGMPGIPCHLPDAASIRAAGYRVSADTKVGSVRAIEAVKRIVRLIAIIKYFREEPARHQRKIGARRALEALKRSVRLTTITRYIGDGPAKRLRHTKRLGDRENRRKRDGDEEPMDENSDNGDRIFAEDGCEIANDSEPIQTTAGDVVAEFGARIDGTKTAGKYRGDRRWAMVCQFYEQLATASARLEAKRTPEKGYDFSADFPKLWGATCLHGGHTPGYVARVKKKKKTSAARRTADVYMRFIACWQQAGFGRSRLAVAFSRWRLNTCDAALDESCPAPIAKVETSSALTLADRQTVQRGQTHTVTEMWIASGGATGNQQDIYDLIFAKERADRALPSELLDAYTRDFVERTNLRQTKNNIPILMPFY